MTDSQDNAVLNYAKTATIANAGQLSGAVNMGGMTPVGLFVPAAFTGTALTFFVSDAADGTYVELRDDAGAAYTVTVAPGGYVALDPEKFRGVRHLKVRSGSAEGAERVIKIAGRVM